MIKAVTFGYRWEGLSLHQWAFTHTDLQLVVLPGNRIFEPSWSTLVQWCNFFRIPIWCQGSENDQSLLKKIIELEPDIILCHCYSYKLNEEILKTPKYGCINIHPGKLPEYKGKDPITVAMDNKEEKLWCSLHYMNEKFDDGELIEEGFITNTGDIQKNRSELTKLGIRLLESNRKRITEK